jgi:hypothetical protein
MPARSPFRVSAPLVLCVLFLTAGSGACSYIFVDGPPEKHRQLPYFTCTTSRAWPVVDTVLGAAYAIDAVGFASLASRQSGSSTGGSGSHRGWCGSAIRSVGSVWIWESLGVPRSH